MSRASEILRALQPGPATTSELYDRIGYAALTRLGLIPYAAFRAELVSIAAQGQVEQETAPDGSTSWRLTAG
ncbi:MAG TPA: hypothetical protein VGI87_10160 [Solirubrobacteraceae bacterium]|jgi:hypothetical protein